ncbi:MAG: DUF3343 domain-containing protein [Leptolinea sp.]|nr:DUF3343 domain-containing protein [Leptolinea sp.]
MNYSVILVDSTSHAMRIEKILGTYGLGCKMIPVPRHLSSDCGVCVRISSDDVENVRTILENQQITIQKIEAL